ncbi:hypothetical protein FS749_003214 [Ceratobasidium sp. UAMH 11750]|nr:hypothetical protein FS749_003214 [Ceratobasidium sp. UAMH 11750]
MHSTLGLPPEIVLSVASYCSRAELCTIASLNSGFYGALISDIYANVRLDSRRLVERFSNTMIHGRPHLRSLTLFLYISPRQTTVKLLHPLANSIRQALSHITSLRDLTLLLQHKAVKSIFRDAKYPFSLVRLACPAVSGREFSRFLHSQLTLEEFVVLRGVRGGVTVGTIIRNINSESLPRLESVSASFETLATLVPGRPVTKVSTGPATLSPGDYETFASSISRSSAQVDVVDLSLSYLWATTVLSNSSRLFAALYRHSVQPKHLTINLTLPEILNTQDPIIWHKYASDMLEDFYPAILNCLEHLDLSMFYRLESLEITQRKGLTVWIKREQPFREEHLVLEMMTHSISSLRALKLFGLEIQ